MLQLNHLPQKLDTFIIIVSLVNSSQREQVLKVVKTVTDKSIQQLVDWYIEFSFSIVKKGTYLIKQQLSTDLTVDQLYILRFIHRTESCTSTRLADAFGVKKSAITNIINRMWKKGFIKRTRDPADRRVIYLTLTEHGEEIFKEAEKRIEQIVKSLLKRFEFEEIDQFIRTYEKLDGILTSLIENEGEMVCEVHH